MAVGPQVRIQWVLDVVDRGAGTELLRQDRMLRTSLEQTDVQYKRTAQAAQDAGAREASAARSAATATTTTGRAYVAASTEIERYAAAQRETLTIGSRLAAQADANAGAFSREGKAAAGAAAEMSRLGRVRAAAVRGFGSVGRGVSGLESAAGAVGGAAATAGRVALGGAAVVGGLAYLGLRRSASLEGEVAGLRGLTGLPTSQATQLAVIAQAVGVPVRALGQAFGTLGKQVLKLSEGQEKGGKAATKAAEAWAKLGITPQQVSGAKGNLPALFDLVFAGAQKLPEAERAGVLKTFLGRGGVTAGKLVAAGPLSQQMEELGGALGGIDPKKLEELHVAEIKLKEATIGIELAFAQAFGPPLIALLQAITPAIRPIGEAMSHLLIPPIKWLQEHAPTIFKGIKEGIEGPPKPKAELVATGRGAPPILARPGEYRPGVEPILGTPADIARTRPRTPAGVFPPTLLPPRVFVPAGVEPEYGRAPRRAPRPVLPGAGEALAVAGKRPEPTDWERIGKTIGRVLKEVGDAASKYGTELIDAFKPAQPFFENVLLPVLEGLGKGLLLAFQAAIPVVKVFAEALGLVGEAAAPLKGIITDVGAVFGAVFSGAILKGIAVGIEALGGNIPVIGAAFRLLALPVRAAGEAFNFALNVIVKAVGGLGNVTGTLGRFAAAIPEVGAVAGLAALYGVGKAAEWLRHTVEHALGGLPGTIAGFLIGLATTVPRGFAHFVDSIVGAVTTLPGRLTHPLETVKTVLLSPFTAAYQNALAPIGRFVSLIVGGTGIGRLASSLAHVAANAGSAFAHQLASWADDAARAVAKWVASIARSIAGLPGKLVHAAAGAGHAFVSAIASFADDALHAGAHVASSLIQGVAGIASDLFNAAWNLGRSVVTGIVRGIESLPHAIVHAVSSIIPGPIKDALKKAGGFAESLVGELRTGGRVRRYQEGGMVPGFVSPGEMILHGGGAYMVPGARTAADSVFMQLPVGAAVLTDDGQARYGATGSLDYAIATQAPHFAHGGFVATAYGPPWGGIEGGGTTATGIDLSRSPHLYLVAVDPSVIPLHSKLHISPNPFGYSGLFSAEDTGGAIKGNRIDFYDWKGRADQQKWGRRSVTVTGTGAHGSVGGRRGGVSSPVEAAVGTTSLTQAIIEASSATREGLITDALQQGISAGLEGVTEVEIRRASEGIRGARKSPTQEAVEQAVGEVTRQVTVKTPATAKAHGTTGPLNLRGLTPRVASMVGAAGASAARWPHYLYGGGHSSFSGPYDCSGYVSAILHSGGFLGAPVSTDQLKTYGEKGVGRQITIGVRGSTGKAAHTMIRLGKTYWEAGGSSGKVGQVAGWDGSFPIKRHPKGYRAGGLVANVAAEPRLLDPRDPRFVGYGLQAGGVVGSYPTARSGEHHGYHRFLAWAKGTHHLYGSRNIAPAEWRNVVEAWFHRRSWPRYAEWGEEGPGAWYGKYQRGETYQHGGVVAGGPATIGGGAITGIVGQAGQAAFPALLSGVDNILAGYTSGYLNRLRGQLVGIVRAGGPAAVVRSYQAVIDAIDTHLGLRIGAYLLQVEQLGKQAERHTGAHERLLRKEGIETTSAAGLAATIPLDTETESIRRQQLAAATNAVRAARKTGNAKVIEDANDKMLAARGELDEAITKGIEDRRNQIRTAAREVTESTEGGVQSAQISVARTQIGKAGETPTGLLAHSTAISYGLVPALRANLDALNKQLGALRSTGASEAELRPVLLAIQQGGNDIATAETEAGELIKQAAETAAAELVETAAHETALATTREHGFELEQRLAGTYEGGGTARAAYIAQTLEPALHAELAALEYQRGIALSQGDPKLASQVAEAIANKQNDILQAQLDAQEAIKENTAKPVGGALGFTFGNENLTDQLTGLG